TAPLGHHPAVHDHRLRPRLRRHHRPAHHHRPGRTHVHPGVRSHQRDVRGPLNVRRASNSSTNRRSRSPPAGPAVDPIELEPVDEIVITTLVDNVYDALLTDDERTTRAPFGVGAAPAPQFEAGSTTVGLMAEHGFSALV